MMSQIPSGAERLPIPPHDPIAIVFRFQSGLEARERLVVRSDEEWRELWARLTNFLAPPPALPPVDFATEMIVVAAMGRRPSGGYLIRILDAARDASAVYVVVEERAPAADSLSIAVMTAPATAARLPRSDLPVRWIERTAVGAGP